MVSGDTGVAVGTVLVASPGAVPPHGSVLTGVGDSSVPSVARLEVGVKVADRALARFGGAGGDKCERLLWQGAGLIGL